MHDRTPPAVELAPIQAFSGPVQYVVSDRATGQFECGIGWVWGAEATAILSRADRRRIKRMTRRRALGVAPWPGRVPA
jgi:hypothetical protein